MTRTIKITDAQMTALEAAGIFEAAEENELILANAITGNILHLPADASPLASVVNDLSNHCDDLSRELGGDHAAWARKDASVLANLYGKILKAQ